MEASAIIEMIHRLRIEGVTHFRSPEFSCRIDPLPRERAETIDKIKELTPEERKKLLKEAEKDFERDLYGSSQ